MYYIRSPGCTIQEVLGVLYRNTGSPGCTIQEYRKSWVYYIHSKLFSNDIHCVHMNIRTYVGSRSCVPVGVNV